MLSDHVKQLRPQVLPPNLLHARSRRRIDVSRVVPLPILVAIILVIVIILIAATGVFDYIFPLFPTGLRQEIQIENTVATSAQVLAAISGLVLPMIILSVEFYGRMVSSVLGRYLKDSGLLTIMLWSLSVTGFDILALAAAQLRLIPCPQVAAGVLFILVALTIGVIIEVMLVVCRTVGAASLEETLLNLLRERLDDLILRSFEEELDYRHGRLLFIKILDGLQVGRVPLVQPQLSQMTAVLSTKEGILRDVDLRKLEEFIESVRQTATYREERQPILFNKLPGDLVRQGEPIAYVSSLVDSRGLQKKLQHCLIIKHDTGRSEDPRLFLDQLKDMTVNAAEQHIESRFESLFDLYARALELNAELMEPPPASEWDFIRAWRVITLVRIALYGVLRVAAKSGFADHCCHRLYSAARYAASRRNVKALQLIAGFFESIYLHSLQAGDKAGVHHSFNYLSRDLVDDILEIRHPVAEYTLERAGQTRAMLHSVFDALFNILHQTIKERDLPTYQRLLNRLQVEELFARYSIRQDLRNRKHDLERQLHSGKPTGANDTGVRSELGAVNQLLLLPREFQKVLAQWQLLVGSHLLRSYAQGSLSIELLRQFLKPLEPVSRDLGTMATTLEQMFMLPHVPERLVRFEEHLDTRQVVTRDPVFDQLRFYCVMGTCIVSECEDMPPLPEVEFVGRYLDRIRHICEGILQNAAIWAPLIRVDDVNLAVERFLDFNRDIAQNWKRLQEDRVIASPLNRERVNEYTQAVLETWDEGGEIRSLLASLGRAEIVDHVRGGRQVLRIYKLSRDKDAFVTKQENGLAQQIGQTDGSILAHRESGWIVQRLIHKARVLPTRKDWLSLQPYFERGIQRLRDDGFQPSIIFIPWECDYHLLESLPGFIPQYARQHKYRLSGLRGFIADIPVVTWEMTPCVLVADLTAACDLRVQRPEAQARTLNNQEIARLKEEQPKLEDREVGLWVARLVKSRLRLGIVETKALVKLPLKSGIPLRTPGDF